MNVANPIHKSKKNTKRLKRQFVHCKEEKGLYIKYNIYAVYSIYLYILLTVAPQLQCIHEDPVNTLFNKKMKL